MYDARAALQGIDAHAGSIMACLTVTVVFAFVYFFIAFGSARKQQVYVYLGFVAAFVLWPLANVWLILRLPAIAPARVTASARALTA